MVKMCPPIDQVIANYDVRMQFVGSSEIVIVILEVQGGSAKIKFSLEPWMDKGK